MNSNPLVSVVIPVYNVEKYLRECVDSVLKQTYRNLEIILVDDGSNDSSGKICDEYAEKDKRVKVIHKENGGASSARNVGIAVAEGEYLYMPDSDDWINDDAIERLVKNISDNNSDFVFFNAVCFSDSANQNSANQGYIRKQNYPTDSGKVVLLKQLKYKEYHVSIPLLLIKKAFLDYVGVELIENIELEDMIYTYQLYLCADRVSYCSEQFYHRRYRENSVMQSRNWEHKFKSSQRVYNEIRDFNLNNGFDKEQIFNDYLVDRALNSIEFYCKISQKNRKQYKMQFKSFLNDLKNHGYYGSKSLKYRTYGIVPWFVYKVIEKVF